MNSRSWQEERQSLIKELQKLKKENERLQKELDHIHSFWKVDDDE